ncbi:S-acyl fatty acid synthase thioesterase, medium chain [Protopterus annectens]|uniref:S-acyl fatty acid synthase thioesterase, medium chain n=1 Tax=Protopterus annectens TaxID=7888 RepID=UPI001CFACE3F|nr:S-acyl fatty acid synthase thioesterase, medium chain [Protopterus annectens]XP_043923452.1 S-acyl fatty acid synthase thioesterase, medium chain [Protopterus annectens]XP_043923454.1 S-acyl fatty acid synthase thioesterase, medium chain [Protopterus annectens]XP_043923455.1 S-acyl fatty acid synthase thioesterase, medium chain [Protopterus annectens]
MEKLVNCLYRKPEAVSRLICFPWAGGGSIHYAQWGKFFNSSVEVYSLRLAGRESRAREPFANDMKQIVNEIIDALLPVLQEKPFAFFGHSFGALMSFSTAEHLKRDHGLQPLHLFVSGASAPHSKARYPIQKRSELSDDEFLTWMTSVGGTPPEILKDKSILQLFLPVLKADLKVVESFSYEKPPVETLCCPVTAFDGVGDVPHDLEAWKVLTSGDFTIHKLPGGHFYLKDPSNEAFIVDYIMKNLENVGMDYF